MPPTLLTPETRPHRADLNELVRLAKRDLAQLMSPALSPVATREALMDVLPQLVDLYGSAAATLGADWYDDLRDKAEARGRFTAIPADLPDRGRTDALARWGVEPMFAADPDFLTTLAKVSGGLQRIIANADRKSVMGSSVADRNARGWSRVGAGECGFCQSLIGRGSVYSEAGADFESHDHCGCIAVPDFG